MSLTTIKNISDLLSQWIVGFQRMEEIFAGKLGGKNKIVEIDKSCFFRRKYNKGRLLNQIWCFGLVERNSDRLIVEIVEKRNSKTLLPLVQKWVALDTAMIVSDEWKAYKRLKKLKYNHKTVNHSKNFVDAEDSQIHTQTIENRWGQIKSLMKKRGKLLRENFSMKLKEATWRMAFRKDIQLKMLEVIQMFNH